MLYIIYHISLNYFLGSMGGWRDGLRVGFININDMYNNDVGQGVVYAYEAYEAK